MIHPHLGTLVSFAVTDAEGVLSESSVVNRPGLDSAPSSLSEKDENCVGIVRCFEAVHNEKETHSEFISLHQGNRLENSPHALIYERPFHISIKIFWADEFFSSEGKNLIDNHAHSYNGAAISSPANSAIRDLGCRANCQLNCQFPSSWFQLASHWIDNVPVAVACISRNFPLKYAFVPTWLYTLIRFSAWIAYKIVYQLYLYPRFFSPLRHVPGPPLGSLLA